ncbi:unnamed protein product [Closterium sp. NIES-65]|nr:unnamed protein product [Closterium sp. NIES-65]
MPQLFCLSLALSALASFGRAKTHPSPAVASARDVCCCCFGLFAAIASVRAVYCWLLLFVPLLCTRRSLALHSSFPCSALVVPLLCTRRSLALHSSFPCSALVVPLLSTRRSLALHSSFPCSALVVPLLCTRRSLALHSSFPCSALVVPLLCTRRSLALHSSFPCSALVVPLLCTPPHPPVFPSPTVHPIASPSRTVHPTVSPSRTVHPTVSHPALFTLRSGLDEARRAMLSHLPSCHPSPPRLAQVAFSRCRAP